MLTIFLIVVDFLVVFFGIYIFDYQVDGIINNPLVILASILVGVIATLIAAIFFMEVTYLLFAKGRPHTTRIKHIIGKQIVAVPLHLFNVRLKVEGLEHIPQDPRFLIYSNHTSELDISIIMNGLRKYPVAFLSKEAVNSYLSIGRWAVSIGCVMLNRENNRRGAESIKQVVRNVQTGSTMVVFPEGTFKREMGRLLRFKNGSFKVALEAGVPLVPLSIVRNEDYYMRKWPRSRHFKLVFHKPIEYDEIQKLNTKELSEVVRNSIKSVLTLKEE